MISNNPSLQKGALVRNNYLLITIDCLRADHLNIYGYTKRITSPAIDQFARHSNVYLNAYACGVPTFLSFPSIFCSIYPSGIMHNMYLPNNIPTFVELLKNEGFRTAAFIDNNPFCSSLLGYSRGFDLVRDYFEQSLRHEARSNPKPKAISRAIHLLDYLIKYTINTESCQPKTHIEHIIQDAAEFMKSSKQASFVWIHLMDVHWPYRFLSSNNPLTKYRMLKVRKDFCSIPGEREYNEGTGQLLEQMYDASIKNLDGKLEMLFDVLEKEGIPRKTCTFITADHGTEFLERGALSAQENMYQEVTRVPLIIKGIESGKSTRWENMVSLLDIPVTILSNEGISIPQQYQGISIFQGQREYCISETVIPTVNKLAKIGGNIYAAPFANFIYSIRDRRYTIVYDKDGKYKLFDRKSDVQEREPIEGLHDGPSSLFTMLKNHQNYKSWSSNIERERVKDKMRKLKKQEVHPTDHE